jgi:glycosyltransferase involved in cell wall biosynthesis
MKNRQSIILYCYSDPMIYPPTINLANILAEEGAKVTVCGIEFPDIQPILLHPNVSFHYLTSHRKGIRNLINYLILFWKLRRLVREVKADWIIGYDAPAVPHTYFSCWLRSTRWGYHQHDYWENPKGWYRFIWKLESTLPVHAQFISFPQEERKDFFLLRNKRLSTKKTFIIFNSPPVNWGREAEIHPKLKLIKENYSEILIYQGGLSAEFSLENVINSIPYTVPYCAFIILGKELEYGIRNYYQKIIEEKKIAHRVFLWDSVSYNELPSIDRFASIGIAKFAFKKGISINDLHLTGASNKLAEYMSSGLPVIAPDTLPNRSFFRMYPIGLLAKPEDPKDIAEKINTLLENPEKSRQISNHNIRLFENVFHYKKQLRPLLSELTDE